MEEEVTLLRRPILQAATASVPGVGTVLVPGLAIVPAAAAPVPAVLPAQAAPANRGVQAPAAAGVQPVRARLINPAAEKAIARIQASATMIGEVTLHPKVTPQGLGRPRRKSAPRSRLANRPVTPVSASMPQQPERKRSRPAKRILPAIKNRRRHREYRRMIYPNQRGPMISRDLRGTGPITQNLRPFKITTATFITDIPTFRMCR